MYLTYICRFEDQKATELGGLNYDILIVRTLVSTLPCR